MKKEYIITGISIGIAIIIAIIFIPYSFTTKMQLEYPGIRIYETVNTIERLLSNGFNIEVTVEGRDYYDREIILKGSVINTGKGYFILATEKGFRIVEGPLGVKDVKADRIRIKVNSPIVIEGVFPPEKGKKLLLKKFEKYKSSIVFKNSNISLIEIQNLKNQFQNFYSVNKKMEFETLKNDILIVFNYPVDTEIISKFLDKVNYTEFITGYNYYYTYANSEEEAKEKIEKLRMEGAVLVNFYTLWN